MAADEFTLSIDEIVTIASEILAMEKKNQKRWKKTSTVRGEDLKGIILNHFPGLDRDDINWTALWVDIYIDLQGFIHSEVDEHIALLSPAEATEVFLRKTEEDMDYFEYELGWVSEFGCLFTDGIGDDIGIWFSDSMWDRLYEIEAIVSFHDLGFKTLTSQQIQKLAKSQRPLDRVKAAMSEEAPVDTLIQLSEDSSSGVRFAVGLNAKSPAEVLSRLVTDPIKDVQLAVFGNASAPASVRAIAMKSENEYIRAKISSNPHVTLQELETLAADKSEIVREAVANSKNCTEEIFARLVKDKSVDVRMALAHRDDLTEEIKAILAKDKNENVRDAIFFSTD